MRLALAFSLILVTLGSSCTGVIAFSGTTQFSGSVDLVRVTVAGDGTVITFVTLSDSNGAQDFSFCGNFADQFPKDADVRVSFTPGTPCNSNVVVVVIV